MGSMVDALCLGSHGPGGGCFAVLAVHAVEWRDTGCTASRAFARASSRGAAAASLAAARRDLTPGGRPAFGQLRIRLRRACPPLAGLLFSAPPPEKGFVILPPGFGWKRPVLFGVLGGRGGGGGG